MSTFKRWRVEADGRRILVACDGYVCVAEAKQPEYAPIIAAAPLMLEALEEAEHIVAWAIDHSQFPNATAAARGIAAHRLILKAIFEARRYGAQT